MLKDIKQKVKVIFSNKKRLRLTCLILSAFLIYCIISLIYFGPSNLGVLSTHLFVNGGDTQQFVWYYNWWPYALTHHLNPFITNFDWYPKNYNLSWSTSIPTLSLIMAPFTLLGSAILSFNLVAILSPVLAALTCFILLFYLSKKYAPSLIGGYIFGFSSFMLGQLLGHPQQYVTCLIPLLVLLFLLLYRNRLKPLGYVILTALTLVLQFGISLEIFATFFFFSALTLIVFIILMPDQRKQLLSTIKYSIVALVLAVVILSPYLYYLILGFKEVPSTIHPLSAFSTDLASLIIPTPITLIGGSWLKILSNHFNGNLAENGAYMGLPILIILLYVFIKQWGNKTNRALLISLILIGIASLGPKLHLIGQVGNTIPMPWLVFSKLPLLKSAQPDRFSMYFFLISAVVIALWLSSKPQSKKAQKLKYSFAIIGAMCLIPATGFYKYSVPHVPVLFQKSNLAHFLPKGTNVLILPFDNFGSGIYYQYASGMAFTQTGGYIGFIPKYFAKNPVILALETNAYPHSFKNQFAGFLIQNKVNAVIIDPTLVNSTLLNTINSYKWPTTKEGSLVVIYVPRSLSR